jgi:hypothetical protein
MPLKVAALTAGVSIVAFVDALIENSNINRAVYYGHNSIMSLVQCQIWLFIIKLRAIQG